MTVALQLQIFTTLVVMALIGCGGSNAPSASSPGGSHAGGASVITVDLSETRAVSAVPGTDPLLDWQKIALEGGDVEILLPQSIHVKLKTATNLSVVAVNQQVEKLSVMTEPMSRADAMIYCEDIAVQASLFYPISRSGRHRCKVLVAG